MTLLPRRELLEGSRRQSELAPLLALAEQALNTWEPCWTPLLEPGLREEAEQRLGGLSELAVESWGGYPGAERRRLLLQRREAALPREELDADLLGLEISGNFLFDPASPQDLCTALLASAAGAAELGDLWLRGDRGGQGIVAAPLARRLDGQEGQVRSVPVRFEARPIEALQLPAQRLPRQLQTVEASLRLDAVASAGFGLSRSRMVEKIRQGEVRVDWQRVTTPSRELAVGERVQLAGRGELTVDSIRPTQRGRWRLELSRH
ncbi:MAG: photosystem II S4 domain protein [Synechococcaceae cyanobacterium]|nr:photosystem II S4 domain protein [Synechococcaceae cyanobacterium]